MLVIFNQNPTKNKVVLFTNYQFYSVLPDRRVVGVDGKVFHHRRSQNTVLGLWYADKLKVRGSWREERGSRYPRQRAGSGFVPVAGDQ